MPLVLARQTLAACPNYLANALSPDSPISKIVDCRPVCSDISSEKFYKQIQTWINACSSKHSRCQTRRRTRLPTRVIDVGTLSLSTSNGECGQYVTLSYCWGNKLPLRLVSSNLERFQKGIPLELLPPLFQDAITIVRRLRYRYLWIDALCIIQDSEMDWVNESAKMGEIFRNASLTILADAAEDSSLGLFSIMEQERQLPSIVIEAHSPSKGIQGYLCAGIEPRPMRDGPLSGRAWTLQEELLSPCVIRFTESQVWWQCREAFRCETYPNSLPDHTDRQEWNRSSLNSNLNEVLFKAHPPNYRRHKLTYAKDIFPALFSKFKKVSVKPHNRDIRPALLRSWYMILNTYCCREMTYVKDTFPAISGIAREYCRHGLQGYKAGLWLEDMHLGLLWSAPRHATRTRTPYIAPSWSWASMGLGSSGIEYNRSLLSDIAASPLMRVARIESVKVALLCDDPFGQIKAANIVMRGPSIQICRNDVPCEFMDIRNKYIEDGYLYTYGSIKTPRDDQEYGLHWSRCKTATCNIWTVESVTRESPHPLQHPCLLLHVASHQGRPDWGDRPQPRYAFCLILERVPDDEKEETSEQNEPMDTDDRSDQSKTEQARETVQSKHISTETGEKPVQYRRIGLAMLQETVPTHTIWSKKTVTII